MRFQVPQFTEVEDKIIGPFTLKQFIYIAGAAGFCLVFYSLLPLFIAIIFMVPVGVLGAALAFLKINKRPFIKVFETSLKYFINSRLYVWRHEPKKIEKRLEQKASSTEPYIPRLTASKLKDLSWSLDIKEHPTEPPRDDKVVR
ncbi:MAG: Uncharacterized protein G01um1014107_304 [Parcubacteria group bacterium Gr01-1014_107]|nr:MAG: Uncharacterized protein G01um1014107_304 [Parcubacteria group bacterium Gr01-1014_107]